MTVIWANDATDTRLTPGLDYELYGTPGGHPVLVQHGLGSAAVGRAWADAARAQGVELISVASHDIVEPVLDQLGVDRYGVWGVSGGAPHAFALAGSDERVTAVAITSGVGPTHGQLHAITAPVRMWHSPGDHLVPYATAQRTKQLIPGAILQTQAAPGHAPSRDTVRAAMVFLSLRA